MFQNRSQTNARPTPGHKTPGHQPHEPPHPRACPLRRESSLNPTMPETFNPRFPAVWRPAICAKTASLCQFSASIFVDLFHQPSKRVAKRGPKQPSPRTNKPLKVLAVAIFPPREHKPHTPPPDRQDQRAGQGRRAHVPPPNPHFALNYHPSDLY